MSGDLRVSLLFQANAAQAKAEVQALRDAVTGAGQAVTTAGRGAATAAPQLDDLGASSSTAAGAFDAAADAGAEWGSMVQMMRASIHPVVEEYYALQSALQQVAVYEEAGAISMREASLVHDKVSRGLTDLAARMEAAGISIDGTTMAMRRQDTVVQQLINRSVGMKGASDVTIADHLRHGQALDDLRARYNPLFAVSRQYEQDLRDIAEAERLGAISTAEAATARERAGRALTQMPGQLQQVGASSRAAAAYVGQLGFQLNDIGMMMSMGQSPFMLMMQQGPQVVQVFDQMRSSGMKIGPAFAQAFTTMLSPVNLATLAVIGLGAAAAQWLTAGGAEAATFTDSLEELVSGTREYSAASKLAQSTTSELRKEFGEAAEAARELLREEAELARRREERRTVGLSTLLREKLDVSRDPLDFSGERDMLKGFGLSTFRQDSWDAVRDIKAAFRELEDATNLDDRIEAAERLREAYKRAAEAVGGISEAEEETLSEINQLILGFQRLDAERQKAQSLSAENNGRFPGFEAAQEGLDYQLQYQIKQREIARERQEQLAALSAETMIWQQIALFGSNSVFVAQSRLAVERETVAAKLEALGLSAAERQETLAAWDAANGFNGAAALTGELLTDAHNALVAMVAAAPGGGWLAGAIADAGLLAGKLWDAAEAAAVRINAERELSQMKFEFSPGGQAMGRYGGRGTTSSTEVTDGRGFVLRDGAWVDPDARKGRGGKGGGKGGGASEIEKQRDALKDLIAEQERQIKILMTTDPVQQEILRNHEALAAATEAERQKVGDLIAERHRLEEVRDRMEAIRSTGERAFTGWVTGAHSFRSAISMVIAKLAELAASSAFNALWNGNGKGGFSLSGVFDTIVGSIFGTGAAAKADGGQVHGPGGPRDDLVPTWLSNGEYVINAAATAQNLPLLEMINRGSSISDLMQIIGGSRPWPALADGGLVGLTGASAPSGWKAAASGAASGSNAAGSMRLAVDVRAYFDKSSGDLRAEVERISRATAEDTTAAGLQYFSAEILPGRMAEIDANPRMRG